MTYLIDNDYLLEDRYIENMIRLRSEKGYCLRYIQPELTSKGISKTLIRDTLQNMHIDWFELAEAIYQKIWFKNS